MAEAVLLAVTKTGSIVGNETAKAIINKLSEKVHALKELPRKVDQIRMKLIFMSNTIRQIGTVYLTDESVKSWIGEVRKVAYRVEDVVDKYSYHVLQLEEEGFLKKFFIKGTHYVIVFSEIVDELAEIEEDIQQVLQMKDQWLQQSQLVPDQLADIERQRSQDCFPEFVKDDDLVGIKENRRLLTGWLYSEEPDSTVITVSGMGGLGKSTLVTNVYEREKVNFPVHAWIVVSQIYTVDALLKKILWKIGHMVPPTPIEIDKMDVHDLKEEIKKKLQNRKCLIVLDDVWEQEVYFKIHDAFQNLEASRIVITTRKDHVGAIASSNRHLELQPLGGPDAFDLFCRRAFYNTKDHKCPKDLEVIAKSIVDRCQGLPLAIVIIGSLLSSRPQINIWNQTCNQLRSELSNNDHVRAILNLSYHDLSGDLRNCFLYCSLFPEDYPMSRESLVRLWVAEGFVLSKEKNTPEEVAEGNLMELIHRNMLEVVDYDELGRVSTCKMHDIMRDLALSVAKEEKFDSANDYGAMIQVDNNVRRLSLCGWKGNTAPKVKKFPRLRSLVAHGIVSTSPDMVSSILSQSSYLSVLELQDSEITEVPAFIGNLFNLRYIGLRRTKVKSLPESIEKLFNLHTLDIKQTQIEKLPRGIVKVKKLRHLLADRFADEKQSEFRYFIGVEAPKGLSNLEELQTLETVQASKDLAEQLKKLMQLRSIWVDNVSAADCANFFEALSKMPLLSSLLISAADVNETLCLQAFEPISKLHRLIVRGRWAARTLECPIFRNHGEHLKYLALSWCQLGEDPLGVLSPHVPNLTYLSLNRVDSASTLVLSAGCFPHLKRLVLKRMPDVKQLEIGDKALPCIEGLYIVSLVQLDKVPKGIESLLSLKKLWLLNLHGDFRTQWHTNGMHQKMQHVPEIRV
ncbi:disease resistance protein RPM1-like [Phragmites australis]|uniref:disease resistance protein RPM1-like n=1 Tax=Phragmites australis TaxID=29695 RepID=UPI002D78F1F5|nr:disease resistance protein RPM1-like [Phragmites australis]XP_062197521.1 disease resistance protein RPM1-like [Phragmites australis]